MEKIYSKVKPDLLLHAIFRKEDFKDGRQDLIDSDEFLQCAALQLKAGTTFRPHKHNGRWREWLVIAQESWHLLSGKVQCHFYDMDNSIISEPILNSGDSSFTFSCGHNYTILEDATILEYKTGKYEGQQIDKTFID